MLPNNNPILSNNPNQTGVATLLNLVQAVYTLNQTFADAFPSILTSSATYNPPSIADKASASTTVTCAGAALGDTAAASFSLDLTGLILTAYVSAANTVTCVFGNLTGGAVDLGSGTLKVEVRQ